MSKPQAISMSVAQKCLQDPLFLELLPDFKSIVHKANAFKQLKTGCSSCAKRRAVKTIGADFIRLVRSLEDSKLMKFKSYLKVDKVLLNGMNTKTKRYESLIK